MRGAGQAETVHGAPRCTREQPADHPRRRRRHDEPDDHRAGDAQAVRPRLPGAGPAVGDGGARRAPSPQADGPAGRAHPRRPDHAGDARHRLPRRGARDRPGRQARHARLLGRPQLPAGDPDGLRRRPDRVLHHQALAHGSRRALPPRGGGLPVRVVPPPASRVRGRPAGRRALGAALARAPRPARAQRRGLRVLRRRLATRAGRSCGTPASTKRRGCRSPSSSAAAYSRTRATARSRNRSGCAAGRPPTSATC